MRQASCLCGELPRCLSRRIYHCLDCLFGTFAIFPAEPVTLERTTHEYQERDFCPSCGSSGFSRSDNEIEVHPGA